MSRISIQEFAERLAERKMLIEMKRRGQAKGYGITSLLIGCVATGKSVIGALLIQMLSTFLFIVGASSALFGSHGVIRRWKQKKNDDSNRDDFE